MQWVNKLTSEFLSDKDSIKRYIQIRFAFACDVFQILQQGLEEDGNNVREPIIYGVIMSNKSIYIGQSLDSQRRIKDLPIGESHHFAKTIPTELWEKIIVIKLNSIFESEEERIEIENKVKEKLVDSNEKNDRKIRRFKKEKSS
ncbi:GIY-YIG nuclease family protein [Bacillus cereus]|nr:GIY-YIG nuclease family protein [Bacillus cereus]